MEFSQLVPELLECITTHLYARDVLALWFTGDKRVQQKMMKGGVTKLVSTLFDTVKFPTIASELPHLRALVLRSPSTKYLPATQQTILQNLSPRLEMLSLQLPAVLDYLSERALPRRNLLGVHRSQEEKPLDLSPIGNSTWWNLGAKYENLRTLHIVITDNRIDELRDTDLAVLPSTLTELCFGRRPLPAGEWTSFLPHGLLHLQMWLQGGWTPKLMALVPRGLVALHTEFKVPEEASVIRNLPRQITRISSYPSFVSEETLPLIPRSVIQLTLDGAVIPKDSMEAYFASSGLTAFTFCSSSDNLPAITASFIKLLPKTLTTLDLSGAPLYLGGISSAHWPPSLTRFEGAGCLSFLLGSMDDLRTLPRSLTSLRLQEPKMVKESPEWHTTAVPSHEQLLEIIASTYTKLITFEITLQTMPVDSVKTFKFAPNLTKFGARVPALSPKSSESFWSSLPRSLTKLVLESDGLIIEETSFQLPSSLTFLLVDDLWIPPSCFAKLPRQLTYLSASQDKRVTTTTTTTTTTTVSAEQLRNLPQTLKTLSFPNLSLSGDDCFDAFPKSLTEIRGGYATACRRGEAVAMLPPKLRTLHLFNFMALKDEHLPLLPKTLAEFYIFDGHGVSANGRKLAHPLLKTTNLFWC